MRHTTNFLIVVLLNAGPTCAIALADGGQVRVAEQIGDCRITVFTSPNPLRAGPADVSVFIQDAATGDVFADCDIVVELAPRDGSHPSIRAAATVESATNKLFRAAAFELPAAGWWDVRVECIGPHTDRRLAVDFAMEATPPHPPWLTVWPWFSWPIVAVLLFVVHRVLVARRQTHRSSLGDTPRTPSDGRGGYRHASPRSLAAAAS